MLLGASYIVSLKADYLPFSFNIWQVVASSFPFDIEGPSFIFVVGSLFIPLPASKSPVDQLHLFNQLLIRFRHFRFSLPFPFLFGTKG
jgi:hypothetical protein